MCFYLFECDPSAFLEKEIEFYEEVGDIREESYVDIYGNLVLVMKENQRKKLLKSNWLNSFDELEKLVKIWFSYM